MMEITPAIRGALSPALIQDCRVHPNKARGHVNAFDNASLTLSRYIPLYRDPGMLPVPHSSGHEEGSNLGRAHHGSWDSSACVKSR